MTTHDIEHIHGSDMRSEAERARIERARTRQAIAEVGVVIALALVVLLAHGGIEAITHVR